MSDDLKNILTKKPFVNVVPSHRPNEIVTSLDNRYPRKTRERYEIIEQAQFIRELYTSGHKINDDTYYPDKIKYDEKSEKYFKEKVFRASFPFQQIIRTQQLVHLCGNDIHLELTGAHNSETEESLMLDIKKGWLDHNIEVAFYELAKSVKTTGDGALVFYMHNGKVGWKFLSYANGDTLFPHYDSITGELDCFARQYNAYNESGDKIVTYVEVWDDTYMTTYRRDFTGIKGKISDFMEFIGLDGFERVGSPIPHRFDKIPVVYKRNDIGACWTPVQDCIDKYELAVSHLCQNNMAYAFPIMLLKGEDVDIQADMYGAVKAITMGADDDVSYLKHDGSPESFKLQLEVLLKMIFDGSFTVRAPEVKSGDLPGVAIKLIYSPSIDKAMVDAKEYDYVIDDIVRLFKFGYGLEIGKATQLTNLDVFGWIEPYVHQNESELVTNLVQLVNAQLLSHATASTLHGYGTNDELDKIVSEYKQEQQADLLKDLGNGDVNDVEQQNDKDDDKTGQQ